ncbi:MAG: LPXTG cell wall anchor domain-containing protein, partial [Lachnospiraceae bacterium]
DIKVNHLDVVATGDINGDVNGVKTMHMVADGDIGKPHQYLLGKKDREREKLTSKNGGVYYWDGENPGHIIKPSKPKDPDGDGQGDGGSGGKKGTIVIPQTGDPSNTSMYLLMLALSALAILAVLMRKRRNEN